MSELIARQEISLDLVRYKYVVVNAKSEDVDSRWLLIKVLNVGTFFPLDETYQVKLKIETPDGRYLALTSYDDDPKITFEDGCALVCLSSGVLLESGTANAELMISLDEVVISTMPFTIEIIKGTYSDSEVISDPDAESAIGQLLDQMQTYVDESSAYADSASASATSAAASATEASQYLTDVQSAIDTFDTLVETSTSNWNTQVSSDLTTLQSYVTSASDSATSASTSAINAATSETNASASAIAASLSATNAETSASNASDSATLSESWAIGGTDTRTGEDTDNSKYYAELAETYKDQAASIAGGDFVTHSEVGALNGVAALDANGLIETSQIPLDEETIIVDSNGVIMLNEFVGTKSEAESILSSLADGAFVFTTDE